MEKEERIRKLQQEVSSLRELLDRVGKRTTNPGKETETEKEKSQERVDMLKRIRERKIIDDDIPPF